jgi:putative transcriptional regulator
MDSLAGHFLIASPAIMDPNFERAVVLITAHTDEGAVGVILNRCSAATVGEAVPPSGRASFARLPVGTDPSKQSA